MVCGTLLPWGCQTTTTWEPAEDQEFATCQFLMKKKGGFFGTKTINKSQSANAMPPSTATSATITASSSVAKPETHAMIHQSLNAASIQEVQIEEELEATQKLISPVALLDPLFNERQDPINDQSNSLSMQQEQNQLQV